MYNWCSILFMKLLNQIASLVLALVVISATMGVTVNKHYCQGRLVETAVFVKTKHAHCQQIITSKKQPCPYHVISNSKEEQCCSEESEFYQVEDLTNISKLSVKFQPVLFQAEIIYMVTDIFSLQENNFHTYKKYKPPLIAQDVTVLVQSFLL